ncbi:hypothetical protein C1645_805216 [Glomus cerebriforme]|uniref:Uncharacterized protein n=1 Tax=Glomus cerebriforme TaxID=658196 RepID=A0A397T515_9GLOM|nr:hypothetical protein C1645_805216 [Glomus cerebriforme]
MILSGIYFGKAPPSPSTTTTLPSSTLPPSPPPPLPPIPPQEQPLPAIPLPPKDEPEPKPNVPLCDLPCLSLNLSLIYCGGDIFPPDTVLADTFPRTYRINNDPKLARCECNLKFYDDLAKCISCYSTPKNIITLEPLYEYKGTCQDLGVPFGTPPPTRFDIPTYNVGLSLIHYSMPSIPLGDSFILLNLLDNLPNMNCVTCYQKPKCR